MSKNRVKKEFFSKFCLRGTGGKAFRGTPEEAWKLIEVIIHSTREEAIKEGIAWLKKRKYIPGTKVLETYTANPLILELKVVLEELSQKPVKEK